MEGKEEATVAVEEESSKEELENNDLIIASEVPLEASATTTQSTTMSFAAGRNREVDLYDPLLNPQPESIVESETISPVEVAELASSNAGVMPALSFSDILSSQTLLTNGSLVNNKDGTPPLESDTSVEAGTSVSEDQSKTNGDSTTTLEAATQSTSENLVDAAKLKNELLANLALHSFQGESSPLLKKEFESFEEEDEKERLTSPSTARPQTPAPPTIPSSLLPSNFTQNQTSDPQEGSSVASTTTALDVDHLFHDPLLNPEGKSKVKEEEEEDSKPPPPPAPRKLLYEHFLVVGLPPDAKIESSRPTFHEPQILYQYPPDKKLVVSKIAIFCFPEGVKTTVSRRTNSMSNLNEIYYGQSYLHSSESSYVFILTGIDNAYHYGICVTKNELLRESPSFLQKKPPPAVGQRFIVAPRCYCFVSRYPFFSIHFEILYSILAQERLLRIHRDYTANLSSSTSAPVLSQPSQAQQQQQPPATLTTSTPILSTSDPSISEPMDPLPAAATTPEPSSQEIASVVEEEEKPAGWVDAVQILEKYYYTPVPEPGDTTKITLPNGLQTISFSCPRGDTDAKVLADWCLGCTFRILSLENLMRLFNAVMLEKQIIIVSKNLGLVTTLILSLIPLIRPLVWQGLLVPILPSSMQDMVQAPVPFIVGIQTLPERLKGQLEAFIIYLDTNEVVCPFPLTPLPEEKKLQDNLRQLHNLIYRPERINQNPKNISSNQQSLIASLLASFNRYSSWFIESIASHYRSQLQGNPVMTTDQIKATFLQKISPHNRAFVECFLETQHFSMFIDSVFRRSKAHSSSS